MEEQAVVVVATGDCVCNVWGVGGRIVDVADKPVYLCVVLAGAGK